MNIRFCQFLISFSLKTIVHLTKMYRTPNKVFNPIPKDFKVGYNKLKDASFVQPT